MVEEKTTKQTEKLAVILVRGRIGLKHDVLSTLDMLRLKKRNVCVIVDATPSVLGMVNRVRRFVTFGIIDPATLKSLKDKFGDKKHFNLNSPKKGFGKKGIKVPFKLGGALGDRKEKVNDLIQRMM